MTGLLARSGRREAITAAQESFTKARNPRPAIRFDANSFATEYKSLKKGGEGEEAEGEVRPMA